MSYIFSKHNIISKIKNSDNYFIVNSLAGNADIMNKEEYESVLKHTDINNPDFIKKGYITTAEQEQSLYQNAYIDFLEKRDKSEIQIFFVTNYNCNFNCSYCYQDLYNNPNTPVGDEIITSFFNYIDIYFKQIKKYITLFGGEPLLLKTTHMRSTQLLLKESAKRSIDIAIVTNGYHLADYIDILKNGRIREIQVTLDGTMNTHNKRRPHRSKKDTFDQIVAGIDLALDNQIPINLRTVIDKENIDNFPQFAAYCIDKGWTTNPLFKTQIGRNYELHHCQENNQRLFDRVQLYEALYDLIQKHPYILQYHEPAYSISNFLMHNGELPTPLFDSCPGCKTEWAFDYTGRIYPCTATVGKEGEQVGTFYPEINIYYDKIEEWAERDTTGITECRDCDVQLLCGGGCGAVAQNKNGGLHTPDCRPVKQLLEMGISLYFEKENKE